MAYVAKSRAQAEVDEAQLLITSICYWTLDRWDRKRQNNLLTLWRPRDAINSLYSDGPKLKGQLVRYLPDPPSPKGCLAYRTNIHANRAFITTYFSIIDVDQSVLSEWSVLSVPRGWRTGCGERRPGSFVRTIQPPVENITHLPHSTLVRGFKCYLNRQHTTHWPWIVYGDPNPISMVLLSIYHIVPITVAACASCFLIPSAIRNMAERKVSLHDAKRFHVLNRILCRRSRISSTRSRTGRRPWNRQKSKKYRAWRLITLLTSSKAY